MFYGYHSPNEDVVYFSVSFVCSVNNKLQFYIKSLIKTMQHLSLSSLKTYFCKHIIQIFLWLWFVILIIGVLFCFQTKCIDNNQKNVYEIIFFNY